MENKNMLMIPGPTPVPEAVLLAMAKAPIGHRTGAFSKVIAELTENLKWLHQTSGDVLMWRCLNVNRFGNRCHGSGNY